MEEQRAWWKECVVYQIYPRSFQDSNGDGIGDLNGIRSRLDYLKDLGIDVIWLSPVYQSPGDDNGYDISDYRAVMDVFGTMEDFDRLLAEIHEKGMKLVMDLVVNHTSDEHAWFVKSRRSLDNPYRDYYIWKAPVSGGPPNNWASRFRGPAWEYDEGTGMYYLHIYSRKQPDLNWENPRVRQEIYDMMAWWGDKGIDGFRMDVISMLSKDQRFPDGVLKEGNPYGDGLPYYANGPRIHEFLQEMNREVLSRFDWMSVGEGVGVGTREAVQYAGYESHELNMMFHFEHVELNPGPFGKWNDNPVCLRELKEVLNRWQTELEGKAWNSLFWENHDYPRAVSRFGNDSLVFWELSAKMLAVCLYMMKGTPYIYQGQELGMTNFQGSSIEDFQDIEIHNVYREMVGSGRISHEEMIRYINHMGRDNARTPMQWDDTAQAGFTEGTPWLGVNPNYTWLNAREQAGRGDSVLSFYKQLIKLRHTMDILVYGTYRLLLEESGSVYAYERTLGDERLTVLCNFTDQTQSCGLSCRDLGTDNVLIGNYPDQNGTFRGNGPALHEEEDICLRPYEAIVLTQ